MAYSRFRAGGKEYLVRQHPGSGLYSIDVREINDPRGEKWYGMATGLNTLAEAYREIKEHSGEKEPAGLPQDLSDLGPDDLVDTAPRVFPRKAYRGELYDQRERAYIGHIYKMPDGEVFVGQPREYGHGEVTKVLPGTFNSNDFVKFHVLPVSASRQIPMFKFKKKAPEARLSR